MFQNPNPDLIGRFEDWWRGEGKGLPLMWLVARRDGANASALAPKDDEDRYIGAGLKLSQIKAELANNLYLGDSYAQASSSIGPGSLAVYLGAKPVFAPHTVWYESCLTDIRERPPIVFDPGNGWFARHMETLKALRAEAGDDYIVNIPDIVEGIDILAALRGTQDLLVDMMDDPDAVIGAAGEVENAYFPCYDRIYDLVKTGDGVSSYYCFCVLGRGKVAKVQCDFSAMISTGQYRRFALPGLREQIKRLDRSIYHLDGPDAIRHLPAIMEIGELNALQWTAGAGKPDGASPEWYRIWDQVAAAGKGMWVQIYDGGVDGWIESADRFIDRYGKRSCYLIFPYMSERDADKVMDHMLQRYSSD